MRFVAATHRDLEAMVARGAVPRGLFYRLNVVRSGCRRCASGREDIEPLARALLRESIAQRNGRRDARSRRTALTPPGRAAWPGNVRQLQNFIERLVVLSDGPVITVEDVRRELGRQQPAASAEDEPDTPAGGTLSLDEQRKRTERKRFSRADAPATTGPSPRACWASAAAPSIQARRASAAVMRAGATRAGWRRSTALVVALALGAAIVSPRSAAAQAQPESAMPRLDAAGVRVVLDEAARARRWRYAWIAINAALTVGSFALVPLSDREQHPSLILSGIGSGLSTALTVAWPLDVEAAPTRLVDVGDPAGVQDLRLTYGRDERDRLRWPWHLLNVGVGVAYFLILGAGWQQWEKGVWAGVSAFAIGEAQTLTQPSALAPP